MTPTGPERLRARRSEVLERRRRRRTATLGGLAALVVGFVAVAGGDDGWSSELERLSAQSPGADEATAPIELQLAFTGDLLIHGPVHQRALALGDGKRHDFAPLFAELRPWVDRADLAFCHAEVPIGPGPPSSYPIFRAPAELAAGLAATGFDACTTASNHALDQGEEGVATTIDTLADAGIESAGTAKSPRAARQPLILEAQEARVALLAYTSDTNGIPPPSDHAVNLFDAERIAADARRARKRGADAVIVNLHWASEIAPEYVSEPNAAQLKLVRTLLAEPAITALVGQGPHVVQPIRRVRDKLVVFGEGNLISNQGADVGLVAGSQDGIVALLDLAIDADGARVTGARYVPTWTDHADYRVLPVGSAIEAGEADETALRASYERTVKAVGKKAARPIPAKLP